MKKTYSSVSFAFFLLRFKGIFLYHLCLLPGFQFLRVLFVEEILNKTISLSSFSTCLSLGHRKAIDFVFFILYPNSLLKDSSKSNLVELTGSLHYRITLPQIDTLNLLLCLSSCSCCSGKISWQKQLLPHNPRYRLSWQEHPGNKVWGSSPHCVRLQETELEISLRAHLPFPVLCGSCQENCLVHSQCGSSHINEHIKGIPDMLGAPIPGDSECWDNDTNHHTFLLVAFACVSLVLLLWDFRHYIEEV